MSDQRTIKFDFNTAVTGLNSDTGKWDENVHNKAVAPLRGLIMQIDGTAGCHIGRYSVEVNYMADVTSRAKIIREVKIAVRKAAEMDGFFPLRGKKTPQARAPKPTKRTYDTWWVARVLFNTDLYTDRGDEVTTALRNNLLTHLADADGARRPGLTQRVLYVKFDRRKVEPEPLIAHLQRLVAKIMDERDAKGYFPYAEPTFTYQAYETAILVQ